MTAARRDDGLAGGSHHDSGLTLIELVLVLGFTATLTSLAMPVVSHAVEGARGRQAAAFVAGRMRLARQQAVLGHRAGGLVFERRGEVWTFRVCEDGNANGLRRADIDAGHDPCTEGPYSLGDLFSGTALVVDPSLPGPDGSGASSDPVRFGPTDIASFSPGGTCTPGTVYIRARDGRQFAVRVAGPTARTRILRFDEGQHEWVPQ